MMRNSDRMMRRKKQLSAVRKQPVVLQKYKVLLPLLTAVIIMAFVLIFARNASYRAVLNAMAGNAAVISASNDAAYAMDSANVSESEYERVFSGTEIIPADHQEMREAVSGLFNESLLNSSNEAVNSGLDVEIEEFDPELDLDGFDPDEDFGIFDKEKPGPGVVTIHVIDESDRYIDGIIIVENGFQTEMVTGNQAPYLVKDVPYGERIFEIVTPYSYDLLTVKIVQYDKNMVQIETPGPVAITDSDSKWEVTFQLRQNDKMRAAYYLVSPNDRFYDLQRRDDSVSSERSARRTPYVVNTISGSMVRIAVLVEMPSLQNVKSLNIEGIGLNNGEPWVFLGADGLFSLPDWSTTKGARQIKAPVTVLETNDGITEGTGPKLFFVLTLPEAFDEANLRFDGISFEMRDGSKKTLRNPEPMDVVVQVIEVPKLQ